VAAALLATAAAAGDPGKAERGEAGPEGHAGPGPRLRFGAEVPIPDAARWQARAEAAWRDWERRFGAARGPDLFVETADPAAMPGEAGRQRDGRILLSRLLAREDAQSVLLHELAHAFFTALCPGLARSAPVVSELFALHASGDAARRALADERFPFASAARDYLVAREDTLRGDEPTTQAALSRILSQPGAGPAWESWLATTLASCAGRAFSAGRAHAELFERIRVSARAEVPVRFDFLLVEGPSQRTLASEGRVDVEVPAGSILKPSLVAAVPALLAPRPARDAPEWHCPSPPVPGEAWTWERALVHSCNGFFLDLAPPDGEAAFQGWEEELHLVGMRDVPKGMPGRIGLAPGSLLSPVEAVRLFTWIATTSPFVIDALRGTARDGTLAASPDAPWFLERGIALKTGTVRDAADTPHDAWVVAVGPRLPSGEPSFVAALHATGLSSPALLPHLRERLAKGLPDRAATARVQVLGLAPIASVSLSCDPGVPFALRDAAGSWRLLPPGETRSAASLGSGARAGCLAAPLVVSFTTSRGEPSRRRYAGGLDVDPPSAAAPASSVPLRERSARARLGSRLVLTTSEREYVESTLVSEHASGHAEVLKALALVVRHDLSVDRHDGRPPCDTTHCHLFGQEPDSALRGTARRAVAAVDGLRLEGAGPTPEWLAFAAGGQARWTRHVRATQAQSRLALPAVPRDLRTLGDGTFSIDGGRPLPCELLRNQLRLPSCPDRVTAGADGFDLTGRGEGHGEGLDLTAAEQAAAGGAGFRDLIARFYPGVRVVDR